MPVGTSTGEFYADDFEYATSTYESKPTDGLKRVYIDTTMPTQAPTEVTGALESTGGAEVPGKGDETNSEVIRPIPYGLNPPEREAQPVVERLPAKVLFKTKTGIEITDHDIDTGYEIMMNAGPGTIAGIRARGMDRNALGGAQTLEASGKHSVEIHTETGFSRGADGKWRHEIDDSTAKVNDKWLETAKARFYTDSKKPHPVHTSTLGEVLDHPELYKAYPELKNVTVKRDPNMEDLGRFDTEKNILWLGREAYKDKGIIMHEVQHVIQGIEGFAQGGSAATIADDIYRLKFQDPIDQLLPHYVHLKKEAVRVTEEGGSLSYKEARLLEHLNKVFDKYEQYVKSANKEAEQYYLKLAGEVEARNVDTRLDLSKQARLEIPPIFTEDLPRNQQIVRDKPSWTTAYGALDTETGKYLKPAQKSVTQMRKGANDNFPEGHPDRPYNVREPNMIGSKAQDDAIDANWKQFGLENTARTAIHAHELRMAMERKGELTQVDKARINKMKKDFRDQFGVPYE